MPEDVEADLRRRLSAINEVYVVTPELDDAMQLIGDVRSDSRQTDSRQKKKPLCGLITGESGSGKTRLFERYFEAEPPAEPGTRPVLLMSADTPFESLTFTNSILRELEEPVFPGQRLEHAVPRMQLALERNRTELILLEEVSHIVDQKERNAKKPYHGIDFIKKYILDARYGVPVMMSGLPVAQHLFERNRQIFTRRVRGAELTGFDFEKENSRNQFMLLLESYDEAAAFPQRYLSGEKSEPLARRVHHATSGNFLHVVNLIKEATRLGVRRGYEGFSRELLALANARVSKLGKGWENVLAGDAPPPREEPKETRTTLLRKKAA